MWGNEAPREGKLLTQAHRTHSRGGWLEPRLSGANACVLTISYRYALEPLTQKSGAEIDSGLGGQRLGSRLGKGLKHYNRDHFRPLFAHLRDSGHMEAARKVMKPVTDSQTALQQPKEEPQSGGLI